jgi:hypothetical protein
MAWLAPVEGLTTASSSCRRIAIAPGVEILIDEQHPALRLNGDTAVIAEAMRQALASVVGIDHDPAFAEERRTLIDSWSPVESETEMTDTSHVSSETSSG